MKRRRKPKSKPSALFRNDIEDLNQTVIDEQCQFLSKLNRSISRKLKGKTVKLLTKGKDSSDSIIDARVVHAYIEGDRLIVLDVEFDDKRVLVDYTFVAQNDK